MKQFHNNRHQGVRIASIAVLVCSVLLTACSDPAYFQFNEAYVQATQWKPDVAKPQMRKESDVELNESQKENISTILEGTFGTPDNPRLPGGVGLGDFLSLRKLQQAAGPVERDEAHIPRGLYRQHCAHCHGVTGDGQGPTASFLNPYPRDYRLGQFKFKMTDAGGVFKKPSKEDLRTTLLEGIPGTAMPSFRVLAGTDITQMIDYVIYLAIRGEVERSLIDATLELTTSDAHPLLVDFNNGDLSEVKQLIGSVVIQWVGPDKTGNAQRTIDTAPDNWNSPESVTIGRTLFFQGKANCFSCHGQTAIGDGQKNLYDNWTLELLGLDPSSSNAAADAEDISLDSQLYFYNEHLAGIGALKPRAISPRNLRLGNFRGGRRPIDIYQRITSGIQGTPMPGNTKLTEAETWGLVAYVLSLPYEASSR
ncbi:MAG: cytochrome c, partial [Pirellulaceae bacterium]|nr:cytochrome c [Pirellulaceae bacterium]